MGIDISEIIERHISIIHLSSNGNKCCTVFFDTPVVYTVLRQQLDVFLLQHVKRKNIDIHIGTGVKLLQYKGGIYILKTERKIFRSRFIIGADGINGICWRTVNNFGKRRMQFAVELEIDGSQGICSDDRNYYEDIFLDFNNHVGGYS